MILLVETAAGFALFRVKKDNIEDVEQEFSTPQSARQMVDRIAFHQFPTASEACREISQLVIHLAPSQDFLAFLNEHCGPRQTLGVADKRLASAIIANSEINCVSDDRVLELLRGVRSQLAELLLNPNLDALRLDLSLELATFKLEINRLCIADGETRSLVYAIDNIEKLARTFLKRVPEWYGSHFPELAGIIGDSILYARTVQLMGDRLNASNVDFSKILPDDVADVVKKEAIVSMGGDITPSDLSNIHSACDFAFRWMERRQATLELLATRMTIIAPNLTDLVGGLVAARLISHAGSLKRLSLLSADIIQILGAGTIPMQRSPPKRTPKYGYISLADLVLDSPHRNKGKGKMCRSLAAKATLAIRRDALCGAPIDNELHASLFAKLNERLDTLWNM